MSEDTISTSLTSTDSTATDLIANDEALLPTDFVIQLIRDRAFTTHYQPLFSARDGEVYGYEALARLHPEVQSPTGRPVAIDQLFRRAGSIGVLPQLDLLCRETAIRQAAHMGLHRTDAYLFINICPIILIDPAHKVGVTDALVEELGFAKDRIVFELTEEVAVQDYKLFRMAVAYYRDQGYKIAIDDFGVGYGGLKMLSMIEPNFVKIDRHFISNLDRALVRYNLADMIATACHRMGIQVVAEGIEREEELKVVMDMGIDLLQGYYLARPASELSVGPCCDIDGLPARWQQNVESSTPPSAELKFIGQIAQPVVPLSPRSDLNAVFKHFIDHPQVMSLPLVEGERAMGMLQRHRFLEKEYLGRFGYGHLLNSTKSALELAGSQALMLVEYNCTLEEVAQRISLRQSEVLYDDICVTQNGKYCGVVAINKLLEAITQRSLLLAQGTNPLTKLPGNEFIQREINTRIVQNMHFDVCYIDLDHFKPYNDHYGFGKGDEVLHTLAKLIQASVSSTGRENFNFVGHIGGDDFIVVCRPQTSQEIAEHLRDAFTLRLPEFHGTQDFNAGKYISKNRRGEEEEFALLSLSIAIVSTEVHKVESFAQLASIAAEVKRAAKMQQGTSIVRDRRLMESVTFSNHQSLLALRAV